MSNQTLERHLEVAETTTAAELLAEETGFSKQHIKQVMQKGAVWLTPVGNKQAQRLRRHARTLSVGDQLHLYYNPAVLAATVVEPQLLSDCQQYSVWYKPYGALSQGSKWGDHTTVYRAAERQLDRSSFIVHRLDRAASGLILIGHSKRTTAALAALFEQRAIDKHYRVIVHGRFSPTEQTLNQPIDGKPATSHAILVKYCKDSDRSLLDVKIDTGRKHQIRRQLAGCGYPVVGDRLHGIDRDGIDLQLCAVSLAFTCPITGEPQQFNLPDELQPSLRSSQK